MEFPRPIILKAEILMDMVHKECEECSIGTYDGEGVDATCTMCGHTVRRFKIYSPKEPEDG